MEALAVLITVLLALVVQYWLIRLAVTDGILAADRKRQRIRRDSH